MYWSAAFWTMGSTVVDPLILIVCLLPVDAATGVAAGAVVVATAGAETAAGGVTASATEEAAAGAVVTTAFWESFAIQPAVIANRKIATRLKEIARIELRF